MTVHVNQMPQSVKDRYGLKDAAYKQFWAVIGDKEKIFFRSSWEYYYSIFLEKLKREKKILEWKHEPVTFEFKKVKKGIRYYLPDFLITHLDGSDEFVETKGLMDAKSITKMNRMAKYYPKVKIRVVGKEWFKQNLKAIKDIEQKYSTIILSV